MNPAQYIIMNPNLGMNEGKIAAQAAHAAVESVRISAKEPWGNPWDSTIVNRWYQGGHYMTLVLEAADLQVAERYIRDRGFKTALIIDEGRTEVEPLTPTAVGVEILDKDMPHVRETFSVFKLYGTQKARAWEAAHLMQPSDGFRIGTSSEWDDFKEWLRARFSK
jgi:peptidyl-tRNA hydrolase